MLKTSPTKTINKLYEKNLPHIVAALTHEKAGNTNLAKHIRVAAIFIKFNNTWKHPYKED